MYKPDNDNEPEFDILALSVWESEGGAAAPTTNFIQFGRRIERDRSWTVYHVFSGVPARLEGHALTGLSHMNATSYMLSLNRLNERQLTADSSRHA